MLKRIVITGSIFITLAIILGAIAAHSLEKIISAEGIVTFEKGVKYLMYSGLGLFALGLNGKQLQFSLTSVYWLLCCGTILFSGNIFIYIFHEHIPALKPVVHLVPIGGMLMIIGWVVLTIKLVKTKVVS